MDINNIDLSSLSPEMRALFESLNARAEKAEAERDEEKARADKAEERLAKAEERADRADARLEKAEERLAKAEERADKAEANANQANQRIDALEQGLGAANQKIDTLEQGLNAANQKIDGLQQDVKILKTQNVKTIEYMLEQEYGGDVTVYKTLKKDGVISLHRFNDEANYDNKSAVALGDDYINQLLEGHFIAEERAGENILLAPVLCKGKLEGVLSVNGVDNPAQYLESISQSEYAGRIGELLEKQDTTMELTAALVMAYKDELTGLDNKRALNKFISETGPELMQQGKYIIVLNMDGDKFKDVNDTYGHGAGDTVLQTYAKALQTCCRDGEGFCFRQGGDEFSAFLALEASSQKEAEDIGLKVCNRILKEMANLIEVEYSPEVVGEDGVTQRDSSIKLKANIAASVSVGFGIVPQGNTLAENRANILETMKTTDDSLSNAKAAKGKDSNNRMMQTGAISVSNEDILDRNKAEIIAAINDVSQAVQSVFTHYTDNDPEIRMAVAEMCVNTVMDKYIEDPEPCVRKQVAINGNSKHRETLTNDENPEVRRIAAAMNLFENKFQHEVINRPEFSTERHDSQLIVHTPTGDSQFDNLKEVAEAIGFGESLSDDLKQMVYNDLEKVPASKAIPYEERQKAFWKDSPQLAAHNCGKRYEIFADMIYLTDSNKDKMEDLGRNSINTRNTDSYDNSNNVDTRQNTNHAHDIKSKNQIDYADND